MNIQQANHYAPHALTLPAWVSPKLDGVRGVAFVRDGAARMFTQSGREIVGLPHIIAALRALPDGVYDGELIHPGGWGAVMPMVNTKATKAGHDAVCFHIFDVVADDWERPRECAAARFARLEVIQPCCCIAIVPHVRVTSAAQIDALYSEYLSAGYEGAMVNSAGAYCRTRGPHMMKIKPHATIDAAIQHIADGIAHATDEAGRVFKLTVPAHASIGHIIELSVQGFDMLGAPICPAFVRMRHDKA